MERGILQGHDLRLAQLLTDETVSLIAKTTRLSDVSLRRNAGEKVGRFAHEYTSPAWRSIGSALFLESSDFKDADVPGIAWDKQEFYIRSDQEEEIVVPGEAEALLGDQLTVNLVVETEHERYEALFDQPNLLNPASDFEFTITPDDISIAYNERDLLYPELLIELLGKDKLRARELKYELAARSLVALAANHALIGSVRMFLQSCGPGAETGVPIGDLDDMFWYEKYLNVLTQEWSHYSGLTAPANITRAELLPLLELGCIPGY